MNAIATEPKPFPREDPYRADGRSKLARDLITPEGVTLKLTLASAGERAGAFLIDFLLICLIALISLIGLSSLSTGFGFQAREVAGALAMLILFLLRNFYFVVFEIGRRAATPGKRLLGLRVAARNGGLLTASAIFARNFTREVEAFLPIILILFSGASQGVDGWVNLLALLWTGLFLLFPIFNADKLRAGDILAGTWVIRAPKVQLFQDVSRVKSRASGAKAKDGFTFTQAQVTVYGIHELHVLEDVLRKSSDDVKSSVAIRIRTKIDWAPAPGESDRLFLEAYYAALRRQLEQNLLLGKRKEDKFDKN